MQEAPEQPTTISQLGVAVYPSFAMLAGMQLDVFTPLKDGPMTAENVAIALGVGPDKLKLLLYALVSAGLMTVEGDQFANTPESNKFLVRGEPGYVGGRHEVYGGFWVVSFTRRSPSAPERPRPSLILPTWAPTSSFLTCARCIRPPLPLVETWSSATASQDTERCWMWGGGRGGLAMGVAESCHQIEATVLELPEVAPATQRFIDEAGVGAHVRVVAANPVTGPVPGSYDVAVLRSFIQALSADYASRALKNIGLAMEPGGNIYILGRIIDDSRTSPLEQVAFNLLFLNMYDGGQAYTEREHRDWLEQAGFVDFGRIVLSNGDSIVTARKPA